MLFYLHVQMFTLQVFEIDSMLLNELLTIWKNKNNFLKKLKDYMP